MSYVLFSQTSSNNGVRPGWNIASGGTPEATVVNNALSLVASSSYDRAAALQGVSALPGGQVGTGFGVAPDVAALYDLDGGLGALTGALGSAGNVLRSTGVYAADGFSDRRLAPTSGLGADGALTLGMRGINFDDVKNVEVLLNNADLGTTYSALNLANFTDTRVRIGEAAAAAQDGVFRVEVDAAKRGEIDARFSDRAVDVSLNVWSNGAGWQQSFALTGSEHDDVFTLGSGSVPIVRGQTLAEARFIGRYDAEDGSIRDGDFTAVSDGRYTFSFAQLGLGNDRYDSSQGLVVANNAPVAGSLQVTDYVWGGYGNDTIISGAGDDRLFGDFGSLDGLAVAPDGQSVTVTLNDTNPTNYVLAAGLVLDGRALGGAQTQIDAAVVQAGGAALQQAINTFSSVSELVDGRTLPVNWSALTAAAAAEAAGLGIKDGSGDFRNLAIAGNPEINQGTNGASSDVLSLSLPSIATSLNVTFSMFYGNDDAKGIAETASINFLRGGVVVGTVVVAALDGGVVSATQGLTVTVDSVLGDGTQVRGVDDAALVNVSVTGGGLRYDSVSFSAVDGHLRNADGSFSARAGEIVSDYLLKSVSYVTGPTDGNDRIDAGEGNDTITGGGDLGVLVRGANTVSGFGDTLTGGAGNDTFIFERGHGVDLITDFTVGQDRLNLVGTGDATIEVIGGGTLLTFAGTGDAIYLAGVSGPLTAGTDYVLLGT